MDTTEMIGQDGECQMCDGGGCVNCDARCLPPDDLMGWTVDNTKEE